MQLTILCNSIPCAGHFFLSAPSDGVRFSSVQSLDRSGRPGDRFSRDPLPVFSAGGPCEQFWHGQIRPLFDVVTQAFPLPTTASRTLQGALKDEFWERLS